MGGRREEVLDAALAIADEAGLDAVSMRAVADRLGVTPMALYRHVDGKDALLDGLVGRVLAGLLPADGGKELPWGERLRALAYACREATLRHPWSAQLLFSRPAVTLDAVRVVELVFTALLDAGVPEHEVPRLERLVSTFVIGFAVSEAAGRFGPGRIDTRSRRAGFGEGELPAHQRLAPWLDLPLDVAAEFDADLADLERLIEAAARR
ncbi:TetR/AcrR family transcriptional regulator [Yinghuangia seranimata]|uniref:TetR/AcrR family transcriptional regulator n=1 Tax=Yinghuangia seranimata TaxID=408067 RepID=UPI00248BA608|nr:TetR family transcriptional regulator [Yinghuangia seranimata]MDI2126511.1 TetR family transcriptional regulator [Yinghuangia seranimata]